MTMNLRIKIRISKTSIANKVSKYNKDKNKENLCCR